jgi:hypothetical protein
MKTRSRTLVLGLAVVLAFSSLFTLAVPAHSTAVRGRVFATDMATPLAGMTVQAFPEGSAVAVAEALTDGSGRFRLAGLQPGQHLLLLSDPAGEAVAAAEVTALAGTEQVMALALPDDDETEGAEGGSTADQQPEEGRFAAWLKTPLGATITVVATAIALAALADSITDDNERVPDMSPNLP